METVLETMACELEDDVWMMYVNMQCPDPELHKLTGFCPDCDNKYYELKDIDVPVLGAFMRMAMCNKSLLQVIRPNLFPVANFKFTLIGAKKLRLTS